MRVFTWHDFVCKPNHNENGVSRLQNLVCNSGNYVIHKKCCFVARLPETETFQRDQSQDPTITVLSASQYTPDLPD